MEGSHIPGQRLGGTRQNTSPDAPGHTLRDKEPAPYWIRGPTSSIRATDSPLSVAKATIPFSTTACPVAERGIEFVFLSIWRTVLPRRCRRPTPSPATLSASRWTAPVYPSPSGGLLHATATSVQLPACRFNLHFRPGRGLSLMAATSPSSTNRFRTLAKVASR